MNNFDFLVHGLCAHFLYALLLFSVIVKVRHFSTTDVLGEEVDEGSGELRDIFVLALGHGR